MCPKFYGRKKRLYIKVLGRNAITNVTLSSNAAVLSTEKYAFSLLLFEEK